MARLNVKPTRMELNILKEPSQDSNQGHKLPKDKRMNSCAALLKRVRENNRLRQGGGGACGQYARFRDGQVPESDLMVEEIFAVPTREVMLHIEEENVMSVRVPKLHARIENPYGDDEGDVVYSYLASNSQMDSTIQEMGIYLDLLKLAEIEKSCQLMADEIEKTRRRVNGLEYRPSQTSKRDYLLYRNETRRSRTRQPRQNHEGEVRYKPVKCKVKIGILQERCSQENLSFTQHLGRVQSRYKARKSKVKIGDRDRSTVV